MAQTRSAPRWSVLRALNHSRRIKRAADVVIASVALAVLAPPMGAAMLAVRLQLGSPIIFRQIRPGRGEVTFELLKLRTMTNATDSDGKPLPDSDRITSLGALLRRTSVDELPALVNVIKGELSLVGPRPLLVRYGPYYTQEERIRFRVPPGITGWAQVNGRNNAPWDDRLSMDRWYVENWSNMLDLQILCRTALNVVRRSDVEVVPSASMLSLDQERSSRG